MLKYVKPIPIKLRGHLFFNEKWVQERIAEDPSILGLGNVDLKDVERLQPKAGRLDLLLHNSETEERFEVELMLGTVDESHIIRTIEYWDNERKRYPQYDHKAVIVAEEITARFLNVIGLFNQSIPLIAIQMNAMQIEDKIILNFTKVLDEIIPGEDDEEDDGSGRAKDRDFWEKKSSKHTLPIVDECIKLLQESATSVSPNYLGGYIGLRENGRANNFILFFPKVNFLGLRVRVPEEQGWRSKLEEAGFDLLASKKRDRVAFHIKKDEIHKYSDILRDLFRAAYAAQQEQ